MGIFENIDKLVSCVMSVDKEGDEDKNIEAVNKADDILQELRKNERWALITKDMEEVADFILAASVSSLRHGLDSGFTSEKGLNIEDTCDALGEELGDTLPYKSARDIYDWARKFLSVRQDASVPFYRHRIKADERIVSYLAGESVIDIRLREDGVTFMDSMPQTLYIRSKLVSDIKNALDYEKAVIQLSGLEGSGRRFLLSHACSQKNIKMMVVDYERFVGRSYGELSQIGRAIAREAIFQNAGVCFTGINNENCPDKQAVNSFAGFFLRPLENNVRNICICTTPDVELSAMLDKFVFCVNVPPLTRNERIDLWTGLGKNNSLGDKIDYVEAGSKFMLTGREIHKAVIRLSILFKDKDNITSKDLGDACMAVLPPPSQGSIKRINVKYTLEDLKLPERQKQTLKNICAHLTEKHKVYDEWNMESKFAYGRNVSALFVGPPGTGKTMAVHVLSTMMGLPLYKIDLSQVVDKYIGETEKRLEEIFTTAEKSNSILFFDEADSIFGKRSEVNDSKDKYANTEVSYILQRIEQYDGIVILATNYKKNIDEAFMRRMRYLVEFNLPGEDMRRQIWETSFAPEVPLEGVDFDYLSKQFELSGGAIKNIVLNASFLAADEGSPVTMKHILDCIKIENLKMGKSMMEKDFGAYWSLF